MYINNRPIPCTASPGILDFGQIRTRVTNFAAAV
jgi:hypothetical protein